MADTPSMISSNIHHFHRAFLNRDDKELRRGGRFRTTSVRSSLGQVLDLSHCGAMVLKKRLCKAPKRGPFPVEIRYDDMRVVVQARLARQSKQRGIGHMLGLEFVEMTDEQRAVVQDIIRGSRCWETVADAPGMGEAA